ncbi:Ditrans,polycis-undecaprenyl-diphosphate synthase ((2E,6E)-farnesyl-diphosphate specific) [Seminavis robusta]|uniref:Alkyl transferase n=1 Tax=Seminavis robusta TaxID=568900 RepID=A0A9N8ERV2_9STRA|nr:Ditrans,polycis-undecaprenyl-diphosphate synthase ((2E,6E)-farnesyl-diphosphate specific) [Seminavis robusta]|eukprot:Sro1765_g296170.1 Ditrans,polycis-undecaprenyl-diphosphate synthase ((2E,6E)-farnesyl-diphosphate specific) (371) ;mRNA; r:9933-11045
MSSLLLMVLLLISSLDWVAAGYPFSRIYAPAFQQNCKTHHPFNHHYHQHQRKRKSFLHVQPPHQGVFQRVSSTSLQLQSSHKKDTPDKNNNHNLPSQQQDSLKIPRHVALICDGNSRWAKKRGLPSSAGHVAGANQLVNILDALKESGVEYATLFAFSTENWKRPQSEIDDLMRIMEESSHKFYHKAMREHVQVQILGDLQDARIPASLRRALRKLQDDTAVKTAQSTQRPPFTVCFAINYGGRQDIVNASLKLAQAIANGTIAPDQVDEALFASMLCTRDIPDPDLVIRTSGECRLSNYLLWNIAYAELYFCNDIYWPDFDQKSWNRALQWYSQRTRKFGGRQQQQQSAQEERPPRANGATASPVEKTK